MSDDDDAMWSILQSGKGRSDRNARLGFQDDFGRGRSGSTRSDGDSRGGGGSLIVTLLIGLGFIAWRIVEFITPILFMLMLEIAKVVGHVFIAVLSGKRR